MNQIEKTGGRRQESGNVLFLILIAVALFAALSYAVTQSTRSGGGDAGSETSLVNSSTLTQYPAGIRTSLVRMIVSGGVTIDDFQFNPPSDFGNCTGAGDTPPTYRYCVFHPAGGGSTYQNADPSVLAAGAPGRWYFNANFEVPLIGTSGAGGNELIAFLPGVAQGTCRKLNEQYDLPYGTSTYSKIPDFTPSDDNDILHSKVDADTLPATAAETITNATNDFNGQPFGCFYDSTMNVTGTAGNFVYYHVLIER